MKTKQFIKTLLLFFTFIEVTVSSPQLENVTINFANMSPHLNQNLFLRVIDKSTLKETSRTSHQITSANFSISIPAVEVGKSYFIDFFADHNSNGLYDSPPTDHAWRLSLNNALGNDTLNFSHNTSFTDIKWQYLVTINFSGMTPHIGQMLELKLENSTLEKEIGRVKIPSIPSASFSVQIAGISEPGDYNIEFYADHNGNGLYDAPPVDHAWKINFNYTSGNIELSFTHNTSFTDIQWKYLVTVNLNSMTPHLGQLFELRVVKVENSEEAGRVTLQQILVPNFFIFIPGVDLNKDYNIDFYSDHNGSGNYNPPPVDHAWRLTFNSSNGDFVASFNHNTNFTDIQWPGATSVNDNQSFVTNFLLYQNYPNPFNPSTKISWQSPVGSWQTLKVYDVLGNELATLVDEYREAGNYDLEFDANTLAGGVYFYKLTSGSFTQTRKMILIK
ncbi:MAG: T9SS type A sorting domain-containing protein [Ignavibacterium sp.]|nr:T9SS type A sorting domain-containing protein [Ignavibacterium sp.]